MTATERAHDVMSVLADLIQVMEEETAKLRVMRPMEMQDLHERKIVLVAAYEAHMAALAEDPTLFSDLAPGLRADLRTVTTAFQTTIKANERALHAAKDATDQVLRAIASAVREEQHLNVQYLSDGSTGDVAAATFAPPPALTVNQVL